MKRLHVAVALAAALAASPALAQTCIGAPVTVPLAQGATVVGNVTVSNDAQFLYVNYQTTGDWALSQLDLAVATSPGGIPQGSGGPDVASFPYRSQFNPAVTTYTFAVPLGSFTIGTQLAVVAHATATSPTQGTLSVWGAGLPFPGSAACSACAGKGGDDDDHEHCGDDHHGDDHNDCDHNDGHQGGSDSYASDGGHHGSSSYGKGSSHGDGDHHGDDDHHGDGHDDDGHDDGGVGNATGCGATYFLYVLNCNSPE
jgi:hypothetical protein